MYLWSWPMLTNSFDFKVFNQSELLRGCGCSNSLNTGILKTKYKVAKMAKIISVLSSIYPRRTVQYLRERFAKKTPYQKWKLIRDVVDTIASMVGVNVLSDCSRNLLTMLPPLACSMCAAIQIYSLWFYWQLNIISALQSLALSAVAIPVRIYAITSEH